ncbi:hypothetical protein [Sphingomonas ursincola]|uniref:hypothetical protein n=1 Tax=Sphingomonas ursincola TaxID=56361 RepID=UPI00235503E0|nr:hypothetical protein [Sphingomonas ursincola]MBY0619862.1 hypothetical protein [Sphingomonas ursincola]
MSIPRWEIDELKIRYTLEPELDDIFVEGMSDKKIVDRAFREGKIQRPVYDINSVNIPACIVEKYGLTSGNKQRVIALCQELALGEAAKVCFLVDRDTDGYDSDAIALPRLIYTPLPDLMAVILDDEIIHDILQDAGRLTIQDWDKFYKSFLIVLLEIFSIRIAFKSCGINRKLPELKKSLRFEGGSIFLDIDNLLSRCQFVGQSGGDVLINHQKWIAHLTENNVERLFRSHDATEVMAWLIKRYGSSKGIADGLHDLIVLLVPRRHQEIAKIFGSNDC